MVKKGSWNKIQYFFGLTSHLLSLKNAYANILYITNHEQLVTVI